MTNKKKKINSIKATIIFFAACAAVGAIVGFLIGVGEDWFNNHAVTPQNVLESVKSFGFQYTNLIFVSVILCTAVLSLGLYFYVKHHWKNWDGEDEDFYTNKIDTPLSCALSVLGVANIIDIAIVGFFYFCMPESSLDERLKAGIVTDLLYGFAILFHSTAQYVIIRLYKKNNPEKRGNVFSITFEKDWHGSLDELEKIQLYQASYRAYKITQYACLIIMTLSLPLLIFWSEGLVCMLTAALIMLIMTLAFSAQALRQSNKNKK